MSNTCKATVLVVDDEPLLRMDMVDMLQEAGFNTLEAGSAAEAIIALEQHPEIRVVLTDIQMPGSIDGLALSHVVRNRWPPTIIIVCSGNHSPIQIEMPSGACFLAKPIASHNLISIIADVESKMASI